MTATGEPPLAGIRIIDFTTAGAGPKGTSQLGSLGAQVLKLEPPGGNLTSRLPPFQGGIASFYTAIMANKQSAFFDARGADDETRSELLNWGDVLVHNLRPGSMETSLGFGYERCRAMNPKLIYVSISAWGEDGPMARMSGVDPLAQAFAGWASYSGSVGGRPEFNRSYGYIDHIAGSFAASGVMLGLLHRRQTGEGSHIRTSLFGSSMWAQSHTISQTLMAGVVPQPNGSMGTIFAPDCAIVCGDGQQIAILVRTNDEWRALCRAVEQPGLADDPRFSTNRLRVANHGVLFDRLTSAMAVAPAFWWVLQLTRENVPHALAQTIPALFNDPQILDNDYLEINDVAARGTFRLPSAPWQFSRSRLDHAEAPMPGASTDDLPSILGTPRGADEVVPSPGAEASGWLTDIVVADATQGITGPMGASLLAAVGATVHKVEPPQGDYARNASPAAEGDGTSITYLSLNVGKQVTNDLPDLAGVDVLLVDQDSEWLGLDLAELTTRYPRLVVCNVTSSGPKGPRAAVKGGELTAQVEAEYHTSLGRPGGSILRAGPDVVSACAALAAFQGVLAALWERTSSGQGQQVEVSLLSAAMFCRKNVWGVLGEVDAWVGHLCHGYTDPPDHGYQAADGWMLINLFRTSEEQYIELLSKVGLLDQALADDRFDIPGGGRAAVGNGRNAMVLRDTWSEAFASFKVDDLLPLISGLGGLAAPMNDLGQLVASDQFAAINLARTTVAEDTTVRFLTPPITGVGMSPLFAGETSA